MTTKTTVSKKWHAPRSHSITLTTLAVLTQRGKEMNLYFFVAKKSHVDSLVANPTIGIIVPGGASPVPGTKTESLDVIDRVVINTGAYEKDNEKSLGIRIPLHGSGKKWTFDLVAP